MEPPTTMKGIVKMTTKILNSWCERNGVSKALPKKAKQNMLALVMGVSTPGQYNTVQLAPRPDGLSLTPMELAIYA